MIRWYLFRDRATGKVLMLRDQSVRGLFWGAAFKDIAEFTATEAEAKSVLNWFVEGK